MCVSMGLIWFEGEREGGESTLKGESSLAGESEGGGKRWVSYIKGLKGLSLSLSLLC